VDHNDGCEQSNHEDAFEPGGRLVASPGSSSLSLGKSFSRGRGVFHQDLGAMAIDVSRLRISPTPLSSPWCSGGLRQGSVSHPFPPLTGGLAGDAQAVSDLGPRVSEAVQPDRGLADCVVQVPGEPGHVGQVSTSPDATRRV